MTELLTQNGKMRLSGGEYFSLWNFGIPAFRSADGEVTCPFAGTCGDTGGCYAMQGSYTWTTVARAYEYRYQVSKLYDFSTVMTNAIRRKERNAERKGKQLVIRVHDSGDFYSLGYVRRWIRIAQDNPGIQFYAYTKAVRMMKRLQEGDNWPTNFTVIYSEGGTQDHLIEPGDRHSRVFASREELLAAGYDDASADDTVAFTSQSGKIGLVYHGYKSRAWTTVKEAS